MNAARMPKISFILSIVSIGWLYAATRSEAQSQDAASTQCEAVGKRKFSTVLDAPTQINRSQWVRAGTGHVDFCEVAGYVAPSVGIAMWLPDAKKWNGKLIEMGCGG